MKSCPAAMGIAVRIKVGARSHASISHISIHMNVHAVQPSLQSCELSLHPHGFSAEVGEGDGASNVGIKLGSCRLSRRSCPHLLYAKKVKL